MTNHQCVLIWVGLTSIASALTFPWPLTLVLVALGFVLAVILPDEPNSIFVKQLK